MLFALLNNPNSMQALSAQVNPEWLSLEEVAKQNGVTISAVSHSLSIHSAIKLAHFKRIGRKGYLTKEGAALLKFRKSTAGKSKQSTVEFELNGTKAGEQDLMAMGMSELIKNDPFIQLRVGQLQIEERQNATEKRQAATDERLIQIEEQLQVASRILQDPTPLDLTASQRQFLNERIRALAIHANMPFNVVWSWVHDQVGKRHVETYIFEDYAVAIRYLKKVYENYNIVW